EAAGHAGAAAGDRPVGPRPRGGGDARLRPRRRRLPHQALHPPRADRARRPAAQGLITSLLLAAALAAAQTPEAERAEAMRLARTGQLAEALRRFQAIAEADPRDLEARVWVGRLHNWMRHYGRAEQVFRDVLAAAP